MNILGFEFSGTTSLICGISVVCCLTPAFLFLVLARLTGGRITLLPLALQFIPMLLGDIFSRFGGSGAPDEKEADRRTERRRTDFRARIQSANQQFDQQAVNKLGSTAPPGGFNAQNAPPQQRPQQGMHPGAGQPRQGPQQGQHPGQRQGGVPPQGGRPSGQPPFQGRPGGNVPFNPQINRPGSVPGQPPRRPGQPDSQGNLRPTGDNLFGDDLFGPASLPGLHGREYDEGGNQPLRRDFDDNFGVPHEPDRLEPRNPGMPRRPRPRRDTRRTERNDDEIFGGLFDEDGDGHSDY